jgi:hypothetical protein
MLVVDGDVVGNAKLLALVEEIPPRLALSFSVEDLVPELILPGDVLLSNVFGEDVLELDLSDKSVGVVDDVEGFFGDAPASPTGDADSGEVLGKVVLAPRPAAVRTAALDSLGDDLVESSLVVLWVWFVSLHS